MTTEILLVDSNQERATLIESAFQTKGVNLQSTSSLHEAVREVESTSRFYTIVAHCDFLNDSFTSMARLRRNPMVKILFFTTDGREQQRSAPLLPDEIDALIERIQSVALEQSAITR